METNWLSALSDSDGYPNLENKRVQRGETEKKKKKASELNSLTTLAQFNNTG